MALTSRSWRLANLERPDFSNANNYQVNRRPWNRRPGMVQRATRLLKLLRAQKWVDFLLTKAEFNSNFQVDELWHVDRVLGAGAYGNVATWSRLDNNSNVIDEVAVKSMTRISNPWENNQALLTEAVMQRELNLQNCENVTHLRAYKAFAWNQAQTQTTQPNVQREWRQYQEYAPYGHLCALIARYKCWRTSLPEAFLWHLFDSLAQTAVASRACSPPPTLFGMTLDPSWTDTQLVNFDIKSGNVVLGYPDHRAPSAVQPAPFCGGTTRYNYPVIKLVDFGVAFFSDPNDAGNPTGLNMIGTFNSQPPEQIHYGAQWPQPGCRNANYHIAPQSIDDTTEFHPRMDEPDFFKTLSNNQYDQMMANARFNYKLLEKVHVWAIGKILFEAVILDAQTYVTTDPDNGREMGADAYWIKSAYSYQEFRQNGEHQLPDFRVQAHKDTFWMGDSPYSEELLDLIRDCLNPVVARRVDVATLANRTQAGMQRWDAKYVPGCEDTDHKTPKGVDFPKLYYRANDINLMPEGKQPVTVDHRLYEEMQTESPYDPDLPPLMPSSDKGIKEHDQWREHEKYPHNFTDEQNEWITHNGQLMRRDFANAHNPPLAPDPVGSPISTEDPSDPDFRLQAQTRTRGGRKKLSYKFNTAVQNPNSKANKKRLTAKNARLLRVKNVPILFNKARTRNALRRLEAAEAAQRGRGAPAAAGAGTGPPPAPPPPPPPPPPGGAATAASGSALGGNVGGGGGN